MNNRAERLKNIKADLINANEVLVEERNSWAWWHVILIPRGGKLRQKNLQSEGSMVCMMSSRSV